MQLLTFHSSKAYLRAQRRTRRKRIKDKCYFSGVEMERVAKYLDWGDRSIKVICHGSRTAAEGNEFRKWFNCAEVVCTDLFPDDELVLRHNFMMRKRKWIGKFDLLYSNALDHSYDPFRTLRTWLDQIHSEGRMCLAWTPGHIGVVGGDCFGAYLHEYMDMLDTLGELKEVLYCGDGRSVLVGSKKQTPKGDNQ